MDSYVTGMERAVFEGVLFDVVPLLAHHGPARDEQNFLLPAKYRCARPAAQYTACSVVQQSSPCWAGWRAELPAALQVQVRMASGMVCSVA